MSLLQQRRLECYIAGSTLAMGLFLSMPLASMDGPGYVVLNQMASEALWAWLFISNGLSHIMWLLVNGKRWWSPIARWGTCLLSALLYASWAIGFAWVNPGTTAVAGYAVPALGSAFCCVIAWRDALFAIGVRDARRAL